MSILQAIVLGIVQGLTEYLPVSSSGHLILTRWLFGWDGGAASVEKAFDVAVHVGTLGGAGIYLRSDLARLVRSVLGAFRPAASRRPEDRLPWLLVAATIPAAVTGALLESTITNRLGAPWLVGLMLILGSALLFAADRLPARRTLDELDNRHALLVGAAQAIALQPGVSRSGATLTAARALGYERDAAARLSFLMSMPLIAGAGAYEWLRLRGAGPLPDGFATTVSVGIAAAAVTSLLAVWLVLSVVRRRSFTPFVIYRVAAGIAVLSIAGLGLR